MPMVSIVIPSYNSSRTLSNCLDSIEAQTKRSSEVIVIDRFSRDGSFHIARAHGATVVQSRGNRAAARNVGAKLARSTVLLFVDSDMRLPPTLVEECEDNVKTSHALVIPEISIGRGFWAECKSLERRSYQENDLVEAARCFRSTEFSRLGGYDSRLEAGEDWDLHARTRRAGMSIGRVKSVIFHDEGNLTITDAIRKKYLYGKTIGTYLRLNSDVSLSQINPVRRILGTGLKVAPSDPIHGLGFLILKTLEYWAAGMGHILGGSYAAGIGSSSRH